MTNVVNAFPMKKREPISGDYYVASMIMDSLSIEAKAIVFYLQYMNGDSERFWYVPVKAITYHLGLKGETLSATLKDLKTKGWIAIRYKADGTELSVAPRHFPEYWEVSDV